MKLILRIAPNGFRPGRSAHQALAEIRGHLQAGYQAVYDADLKGYFDSIPQDKLQACVWMRVADQGVLKLIRMWLQAPVVEEDKTNGGESGGQREKWSRSKQGTPQGGVISPLLANLYLHWFDKLFHRGEGPGQWAKAKLVRYADDFVVMARYQSTRLKEWIEAKLEDWMGLEINREKTRVIDLKQAGERSLQESLMREIRTSGSMRGESAAHSMCLPLSYSTGKVFGCDSACCVLCGKRFAPAVHSNET